jgi:hypothetical protein
LSLSQITTAFESLVECVTLIAVLNSNEIKDAINEKATKRHVKKLERKISGRDFMKNSSKFQFLERLWINVQCSDVAEVRRVIDNLKISVRQLVQTVGEIDAARESSKESSPYWLNILRTCCQDYEKMIDVVDGERKFWLTDFFTQINEYLHEIGFIRVLSDLKRI